MKDITLWVGWYGMLLTLPLFVAGAVAERQDGDGGFCNGCGVTGGNSYQGGVTCTAFFKTDDSWAGLILRVVLGGVIFAHGAQKLLGWYGGFGF